MTSQKQLTNLWIHWALDTIEADPSEKSRKKNTLEIIYQEDLLDALIASEELWTIVLNHEEDRIAYALSNTKLRETLSLILEKISYKQRMIIALYLWLWEGTESNDPRNISQLFDMMTNLRLDRDSSIALQEQLRRKSSTSPSLPKKWWLDTITKEREDRLTGKVQSPKEKLQYMISPRIYPLLFSKIKQDDTGAYTFEGWSDTIKSKRLEESIIKLSEEERNFIISSFEEYKDIEYIVSPEVYPLLWSKIAQLQRNKSFNFDTFCNNTEFPSKLQHTLKDLGEEKLQILILFFNISDFTRTQKLKSIATILWIKSNSWKISVKRAEEILNKAIRIMRMRLSNKAWRSLSTEYFR